MITTTFDDMPLEMVAEILSRLPVSDQLNARLVSLRWFSALLYDFKPNFALNDGNLDRLKDIFQADTISKLGTITVSNVDKQRLPVYSSRRSCVLPCSKLVIASGNNAANVVKLLRYLCQSVRHLEFRGYSFANISAWQMGNVGRLEFRNVTRFKIAVSRRDARCDGGVTRLKEHLKTLSALLRLLHLPSLKACSVRLCNPATVHALPPGISRKLNAACGTFLARHGSSIKSFEFVCNASDYIGILQNSVHLCRVTNLKFVMNNVGGSDFRQFREGARQIFRHFKALHSCVLKFGSQDFDDCSTLATILQNNADTIQVLEVGHCLEKVSWLKNSCQNLTRLQLRLKITPEMVTNLQKRLASLNCDRYENHETKNSYLNRLKSLHLRVDVDLEDFETYPKDFEAAYGLLLDWIACISNLVQFNLTCPVQTLQSCNYFLALFEKLQRLDMLTICNSNDNDEDDENAHFMQDLLQAVKNLIGRDARFDGDSGQCVIIRRSNANDQLPSTMGRSFHVVLKKFQPFQCLRRSFTAVSSKLNAFYVRLRKCIV